MPETKKQSKGKTKKKKTKHKKTPPNKPQKPEQQQKKLKGLWLSFSLKVSVSEIFRSVNQELIDMVIQTINE